MHTPLTILVQIEHCDNSGCQMPIAKPCIHPTLPNGRTISRKCEARQWRDMEPFEALAPLCGSHCLCSTLCRPRRKAPSFIAH